LKWINRQLPIADVALRLGLRFGQGGMIHCWHPERHQNDDRTPSVSIMASTNRIKCFGCNSKLMSVVDLVMDVHAVDVRAAAEWLATNFNVPRIRKGKHLQAATPARSFMVGHEQPIELLVKSGIWAGLSPQAQRIVPVLFYFAERQHQNTFLVRIAYRRIMRYSGVRSFTSMSKALKQLEEIGWLKPAPSGGSVRSGAILREVSSYVLTPFSDELCDLANGTTAEIRAEIEAERELREEQRRARRRALEASKRLMTAWKSERQASVDPAAA
jgi:hypothetical protein